MKLTCTPPNQFVAMVFDDEHVHRYMRQLEDLFNSGATAITIHREEGDYRYEKVNEEEQT